ncbi:ORC1-type DNA replication protein [Methanogenium sp. MK-MG]|uniref:ORC1-type DNA replication protein n=1 Tax=Methanogenium sp. MK-MG TaxID=2599926 RepID=UPI002110B1C1|nr:ORC1-type DNA replication protein [Methanogenium sp. MK-MG]KAF1078217.1 ORC1-type DNA replication protein 2 [Methanogenium sp. MK-MG]
MPQRYLMHNQTLIRDHEVFEFNYTPETIHYRDLQLRQLAGALSPALRGACPCNTNLRGPPGTGKTTCVRRIFSELEETSSRVVPVFVNCESINTAFRVFATVFGQLFGHQPPLSGIPLQRLTGPIAAELIRRKAVLIVCLDDANYLGHNGQLDVVIRSLVRMYENYPGVKAGVVTTISDHTFCPLTVIDPAVVSVWQPEEVPFFPYKKDEVSTILQDRIRMGLYPGVIPPGILDRIVALTMEGGDLRVGIDLLKHAVLTAERDARTVVGEQDVTTAFETVRGAHLSLLIEGLKAGPEQLLSHIIRMKQEERAAPLTSRTLYESFRETRDVSYTAFHAWLRRLSDLRLIDLHRRAAKGNAHEIELRFDPKFVKDI